MTPDQHALWAVFEMHARNHAVVGETGLVDQCDECEKRWPCPTYEAVQPRIAAECAAREADR